MWWGVVVCVVAVFVNDIEIILTYSLGIQVFLRSREMGRESGGGGSCFCALSLTLGRLSTFHSIRLSSLQSNPPVSQVSKFSGYWKPQEIHSETPDPPGFPDLHFGPTASNPSRWFE